MALTSAQRQARYRERVKARAGEGIEAAVERVRQAQMAEWISDAQSEASYRDQEDVDRERAFLDRVAARPLWHQEGFADWLETVIATEVSRDVTEARKAERRALSVQRRKWRAAERS